MFKTGLILGSFFSLFTVILGAFGAHALKEQLTEYGQSIYDKAVFYQMFHAIGIFIVTFIGDYYSSFNISIIIGLSIKELLYSLKDFNINCKCCG